MSLKRIELEGFKSFPNRTVIDIVQNFTCIVGPNGCGKSNVSDAIRWVLGEQSAKAIRGSSMKDVIFNGTEKLSEMGYAEVTLVFDNSDGTFKWPESEFSVGRKIFRSKGDNEYYINHKKVNRSEILALLRDTGAGKEGFSIVGQGRIAEIINAKPVDRRKIFDEAAGISQVKTEKKEYERKLEKNNQLMTTIFSKLDVMEENLVVLDKQRKAAQEYNRLSNEIMKDEMNYFVYVYENAESEKDRIRAHIKEQEEYIANQEASLDKIRSRLGSLDGEVKNVDLAITSEYHKREELRVTNEKANSSIQAHNIRIENVQSTIDKLKSDKIACDKAISVNSEKLSKANDDLKVLQDQKAGADLSLIETNAQYDVVSEQISDIDKKIESYNFMLVSGADRLAGTREQKGTARGEADVLKENLEIYEKSIEETQKDIKETNEEISLIDKNIAEKNVLFEQVKNERRNLINKHNMVVANRTEIATKANECTKGIEVEKGKLQSLAMQMQLEHGYSRVTTSVLERGKRDPQFARFYRGAVGDLYTVDDRYQDAILTALGGAVNNIVTNGTYEAGKVLEYVKTLHQGRLICYPLSEVRGETLAREYRYCLNEEGVIGIASELIGYDLELDPIFKRLLGRIVVVENYQVGERIWKSYDHGFKVVTLEGEYFDTSGSISAGDNKSDTDKKYHAKKKQLDELQAYKEKLNDTYIKLDNEIKNLTEAIEKSREQLNKLQSDAEVLNVKRNSLLKNLENLNKRLAEQETVRAATKTRLEFKLREISDAESEGGKESEARMSLDEMLASAKEERILYFNKQSELAKLKAQVQGEVNRLQAEIEGLKKEIERLTREINTNSGLSATLQNDIDNKEGEKATLIATKPKAVLTEEENRQIEEINKRISELEKQKSDINLEKETLDRDREDIYQRLTLASNSRATYLAKLEGVDQELNEWTQKILNSYEAGYEVAVTYKVEDYDHRNVTSRISKLHSARNRLGSINQEAESMYNEMKAEYDTLKAEHDDLDSSKNNLEKIIERIKQEMDVKFNDAFEKIKVNFQQTFKDLFGGGDAELNLIQMEDDPEEQGVEVSVRIPEKSRKPLSLLSGGEQSLTAIALLFAIIKLKPSPFIVLDEVESALDDVNCMRFARYLRQFSQYTRFLVISHKKFTMEMADVLYGVSMEKPGVSNIWTLSLKEAIKIAEDDA